MEISPEVDIGEPDVRDASDMQEDLDASAAKKSMIGESININTGSGSQARSGSQALNKSNPVSAKSKTKS